MLGPRITVGAYTAFIGYYNDYGSAAYVGLSPYLRYYAVNRGDLMIFGQLSTGFSVDDFARVSAFSSISPQIGLHYPLAAGVLFTPTIGYYGIGQAYSALSLGVGLQLVLGKNNRPEGRAVSNFQRGTLMAGAQGVNLSLREQSTSYGTELGAYYFLTDRVALGVAVAAARAAERIRLSTGDEKDVSYVLGVGIGSRYYFSTARHVVWFAEAGVSYDRHIIQSSVRGNYRANYVYLLGGGGAQIFLRDNVALEVGPQLQHRVFNEQYRTELDFGLNLGIRFFL